MCFRKAIVVCESGCFCPVIEDLSAAVRNRWGRGLHAQMTNESRWERSATWLWSVSFALNTWMCSLNGTCTHTNIHRNTYHIWFAVLLASALKPYPFNRLHEHRGWGVNFGISPGSLLHYSLSKACCTFNCPSIMLLFLPLHVFPHSIEC